MVIGIDIDNTIHDYHRQLMGVTKRLYDVDLPKETFDVYAQWPPEAGMNAEKLQAAYNAVHDDNLIQASPLYPGVIDAITDWRQAGHKILIVSARSSNTQEATGEWLCGEGLEYDWLECTGADIVATDSGRYTASKIATLQAYKVDWLIDDHPNTLVDALILGCSVATLRHPWLRNFEVVNGVMIADSWEELHEKITPLLIQPPHSPWGHVKHYLGL